MKKDTLPRKIMLKNEKKNVTPEKHTDKRKHD